jgi:hypothetical protein
MVREEMPIFTRSFDLLTWLLPATNHFPRAHRHGNISPGGERPLWAPARSPGFQPGVRRPPIRSRAPLGATARAEAQYRRCRGGRAGAV